MSIHISPESIAALTRMFGQAGSPSGLDTPGGVVGFQRPPVMAGPPEPSMGPVAEPASPETVYPGLTPTQARGAASYLDMIPQPDYEKEPTPDLTPRGAFENAASFLPAGMSIPFGRQNDSGQRARVVLANFLLNAIGERGRTLYKARTTREQAAYEAAQKENERKRTLYETRRTNALSAIGAKMLDKVASEEPQTPDRLMTQKGAELIGKPQAAGVPREEVRMIPKPTSKGSGGGGGKRSSLDVPLEKMSDVQMDEAARYYAITGELPGNLSKGARDKEVINLNIRIGNRASELFPGNSLALSKAAARGDSQALGELKKMQAGVGSFSMAAKGVGEGLKARVKTLADTGSPWLNRPFRDFMASLRGDPALRAYNAFREGALNEYSKLITTPKLSAAAVTVSARKHMDDIIARGATVEEVIAAIDGLREEGEIRERAINESIRIASERLTSPQGMPAAPSGFTFK